MKATVKTFEEMPSYLTEDMTVGHDERGDYGFVCGMQKKMGKAIDVVKTDHSNGTLENLYDYIDEDGYCYRKEWLKII